MNVLGTLLKYELLQLVRDSRTVLLAIVAPILLLPGILWIGHLTERADDTREQVAEVRVRVAGPDSAWADTLLTRALAESDSTDSALRVRRVSGAFPDSLVGTAAVHVVLLAPGQDDDGLRQIELRYRAGSGVSRSAANRLRARLERVRETLRDSLLVAAGVVAEPDAVLPVETANVASAGREAGAFLGSFLLPILVAMMMTGGSLVAADTLSGEKERGTLETLLTSSASRGQVIAAKGLAIGVVALVMTLVNVVNLRVWLGMGFIDLPRALDVSLTLGQTLALVALLVPVVGLVSAVLLLVSGRARSYREYQLHFPPVFLLSMVPAAAAALPGLELRSAAILVPVANVSLAMRDILAGRGDLLFGTLALLITAAAALWTGWLARSGLSTERLLSDSAEDRAEHVGGPTLFPYRVLRWFGLMWVGLLGLSLALGEADFRVQITANLVGLFFGVSVLMILRYRLPVREVLALRPVHPLVWPAVLVGAPSAFVVGVGLAEALSFFLPMPPRMVEAFGQYLLPESMGLGQMLLFMAVLPGITEEIAFRGLLLHGLRKRFGPVVLCLIVGGIFGLFHVSLFRILPTAYLGTLLALVTILTGSIFPAMLWHMINNAAVLIPTSLGWIGPDLGFSIWLWLIACVTLGGSLLMIRRAGRGYPGVTRPEADDVASPTRDATSSSVPAEAAG